MDTIKKYRIEYVRDPKLKPRAVHGVFGGPCDNDAIEVSLYTESELQPREKDVVCDTETGMPVYESYAGDDITVLQRKVHSRIMLNVNTAKYLIYWLDRCVDILEKRKAEQHPADEENIAKE